MNNNHNGTGLTHTRITEMIISSLQDILKMTSNDLSIASSLGGEIRLIGHEAVLDSMGLVNLIVELEQRLEEEYDMIVVLADERAMSQKNSPFRSVQTLADYIYKVAEEQN